MSSSHNASSMKRHGSMSSSHTRSHHGEIAHHELAHTLPTHHHYDAEWEAKEELRLRELEEARARAAQMEKTMRWWSDCTANWREKWSKVRTERNKSREESRILRTKLESSLKECSNLKREKQDLETELYILRKEAKLAQGKSKGLSSSCTAKSNATPQERSPDHSEAEKNLNDLLAAESKIAELSSSTAYDLQNESNGMADSIVLKSQTVQTSPVDPPVFVSTFQSTPEKELLDKLWFQSRPERDPSADRSCSPNVNVLHDDFIDNETALLDDDPSFSSKLMDDSSSTDHDLMDHRIAMLQLRLDEATKTFQAEREEKTSLTKLLDKLQEEMNQLKLKYDSLKQSKQEALKELNQLKASHQEELINIRLNLEDEANSRSSMDRRLGDLRSQLESLQAENAAEWGKRERLETEKLTLERENKKMRTHIEDLEERLERKNKQFTAAADSDLKALQQEIYDKNKEFIPGISTLKELADLKHAHNKLKKLLQDKLTELGHSVRRSEQYETEVKKLRCRVEELKKELAAAEDEVDCATNNIRKLQRTNDELQEQVDSLQVQVEHLQTRLRSTNHSLISRRGSPSLLQADNLSEDENIEY